MVQCALRGRPLDHPEAQITLLFGLPLPGLEPTIIWEEAPTPTSNGGRQATAVLKLIAAANALLDQGQTRLAASDLAEAAQISEVTARTHWQAVAQALGLRDEEEQISARGRARTYRRRVLVRADSVEGGAVSSTDQADNKDTLTCLIHTALPAEALGADAYDACESADTDTAHAIPLTSEAPAVPARRPRARFIRPRVQVVLADPSLPLCRVHDQSSGQQADGQAAANAVDTRRRTPAAPSPRAGDQ
jgi:hypothetical protein